MNELLCICLWSYLIIGSCSEKTVLFGLIGLIIGRVIFKNYHSMDGKEEDEKYPVFLLMYFPFFFFWKNEITDKITNLIKSPFS